MLTTHTHLFLPSAFESSIVEIRKFAVDLTLAHQYLSQFAQKARDSILTTGSTIIFNVDLDDARYLSKTLRDKIRPEDIAAFEVGEAVARIETEIVRIKTPKPSDLPKVNFCQRIVDESHRRYCKPASEVRDALNARNGHVGRRSIALVGTPVTAGGPAENVDFRYEEFE